MGQQTNFWMTEDDECDFISRLAKDGTVWTPRRLPLGEIPQPYDLSEWEPSCDARMLILIRRIDWPALRYKHISASPIGPETFTPWTMVGCESSPCIEWKSCARTETSIRRGRIYLQTTWFADGLTYKKDADVINWYKRVAGWLKRHGQPWQHPGQYLMANASECNVTFEPY